MDKTRSVMRITRSFGKLERILQSHFRAEQAQTIKESNRFWVSQRNAGPAARSSGERPVMDVGMSRRDEAFEERVRGVGLALKFGMELAGDVKGVILQFDNLHQFPVWGRATEREPCFFEWLSVSVIELVAVTMTLIHDESAVKLGCTRAYD
jgi:hypothetical protein